MGGVLQGQFLKQLLLTLPLPLTLLLTLTLSGGELT